MSDILAQIRHVLDAEPRYSIEVADRQPFRLDSDRRRHLDSLREAGLPE